MYIFSPHTSFRHYRLRAKDVLQVLLENYYLVHRIGHYHTVITFSDKTYTVFSFQFSCVHVY